MVELAIVIPILLMMFGAVAEFGRYFYEYTTLAKGARVGARYMSIKTVKNPAWILATKRLVVYGNTAGTGTPLISGLTIDNVEVQFQGGTFEPPSTGVPQTVTVSIINYNHQAVFDLGKLTKISGLSTNVAVKPSVTMHYMLNAAAN